MMPNSRRQPIPYGTMSLYLHTLVEALNEEARNAQLRARAHAAKGNRDMELMERGIDLGLRSAAHLVKGTVIADLEADREPHYDGGGMLRRRPADPQNLE